MEVFLYELVFFLFALIIRVLPVAAVICFFELIRRVVRRIKAHRREKREREARKVIYRRRAEQYRKECAKCYRQE